MTYVLKCVGNFGGFLHALAQFVGVHLILEEEGRRGTEALLWDDTQSVVAVVGHVTRLAGLRQKASLSGP